MIVGAQAKPVEKKPAAMPAMEHDHGKKADPSNKTGSAEMSHDMSMMGTGPGMGEMKSGWGELDAFHTLLMSVWHPAQKDSLTMARSLAPTMVASAEGWAKSKGPAACDNAVARKALSALVADAKAYAGAVTAKANDAAVKAGLKKVHDGFETAGEPCVHAAMEAAMKKAPTAKPPQEMDHARMNHAVPAKKP
jgi:hypothetical protein